MYDVDRIVAIIKPKKAMLDWLQQQPDIVEDMTLDELRKDCTALLIPLYEDEHQANHFIMSIYEKLFVNELASWNTNQASWPSERTPEMFFDWFDIEFHSLVFDLVPFDEED